VWSVLGPTSPDGVTPVWTSTLTRVVLAEQRGRELTVVDDLTFADIAGERPELLPRIREWTAAYDSVGAGHNGRLGSGTTAWTGIPGRWRSRSPWAAVSTTPTAATSRSCCPTAACSTGAVAAGSACTRKVTERNDAHP
jgi:hypothetical protein